MKTIITLPVRHFLKKWNLIKIMAVLILFSFSIFNSCKKSDDMSVPIPPEGKESLGAGYDVFENYADVYKLKAAILDVDKLNADGLIETKTVENSTFTTTTGTTIEEYREELAVNAYLSGSYNFFSGSVTTNFYEECYSYESYSFATVKSMIQKVQIRLPIDISAEELKPYLTATARSKLNDPSVSPEYIFDIYGTHCLTGVILGGRLDYNVSAMSRHLNTQKGIGVYAEASFSKGGVSVGGGAGMVTEEEYTTFMKSQKKILHVYGGQSEFGQDIINKDDYDKWINSVDNNMVFCNFTQHGLVPVWDLVDNQDRKEALLTAYESWSANHEIIVNPEPKLCMLDVKVFFGNVADPLLIEDREYHRLPADLNASVGGSLIYIYYLLGYDNDLTFSPIAEVTVIDQTAGHTIGELPGTGWVMLPEDLNKGAGGQYLNLAYRRSGGPPDYVITGLRVEHVAKANSYYSQFTGTDNNWYGVLMDYYGVYKQDLNEGSGGWFIYLYYTRDEIYED